MKKGKIIPCVVTEVGVDEIKYKDFANLEGPVYVVRKTDVMKMVFKNGKIEYVVPDEMDMNKEEEILDKNQCIKLAFLSPVFNHLEIAYERKLKMTKNIELKVGFVGIGNKTTSEYKDIQGAYFAGGIKFLLGQDYYIKGMRYLHPLKGSYIKPELSLSVIDFSYPYYSYNYNYNYNYYYYYTSTTHLVKYRSSLVAFNLIFGKQFILGNILTVDIHAGIGAGMSSLNIKSGTTTNDHSPSVTNFGNCITEGNDFPLTLTGSISIGYIFK
jgi:hypothetical protein